MGRRQWLQDSSIAVVNAQRWPLFAVLFGEAMDDLGAQQPQPQQQLVFMAWRCCGILSGGLHLRRLRLCAGAYTCISLCLPRAST